MSIIMKVISKQCYHIRSLIICLLLIDEVLFKNVVTPFVVGVMRKEIVTVRLAIVKQHNMIEGTHTDFHIMTVISTLTLPNDWVLQMDPPNHGEFQTVAGSYYADRFKDILAESTQFST